MSTTVQQHEATKPGKAATGDFVWYELRTTDAKAAEDFYTHVVGWQAKGSGDPAGMPYRLFSAADYDVAGLLQLTPEMLAGGMRPAWVGFIGVDDVDAYAARLEQAGGKLNCSPMDIPGIGRFAAVQDPQGAHFVLFKGSRLESPARPPFGMPGTVGWHELSANDEKTAWPFYSGLFGWKEDSTMDMGAMGVYRMFNHGGPAIGAVMTRDPGKAPGPFWLYYFSVADIDAAEARLREKQGQILMGPHPVPGDIYIILGMDPQGANFALVGPRKK